MYGNLLYPNPKSKIAVVQALIILIDKAMHVNCDTNSVTDVPVLRLKSNAHNNIRQ